MNKKIWLSSPHMGGTELKYIHEAFDANWVAPLGPNVDGFEKDLESFLKTDVKVAALSAGTAASHLASQAQVTKFGSFLRKSKLDELPQLINVLVGDMSLVGARPCLFNQTELIEEREKRGVFNYLPGITGLGQINNVDMSTPEKLAKLDAEMYQTMSIGNYFKYILATVTGSGQGDAVKK
ncbi:sugar transferase [Empedobacter falsenii]|uniref:sugar transferase n=1 Tax=Empedobacter falsenii TaxID=343874 RepID=UPI003A7FE103